MLTSKPLLSSCCKVQLQKQQAKNGLEVDLRIIVCWKCVNVISEFFVATATTAIKVTLYILDNMQ